MQHYAIIGFGCAGYHAAQAIRTIDKEGCIDVYSNHSEAPYNPMLTTYHAGKKIDRNTMFPFGTIEKISAELNINFYGNTGIKLFDPSKKEITTDLGTKAYDKVLVASGASAFAIPIEGADKENVYLMRTQTDSDLLLKRLEENPPKTAIVIGASMVGIKVAELLNKAGVKTMLCDLAPYLFPLAAYKDVADVLSKHVEEKGVKLMFETSVAKIVSENGRKIAVLTNGEKTEADIILLCVGTRTNLSFVKPGSIRINKGILVDETMQSSAEGVYAAGDCCEGNDIQDNSNKIIGLWANAGYQGRTAGINMAGGKTSFKGNILHNITHFMDIDFIGLGNNRIEGETLCFGTADCKGLFVKAILKDGKLAGVNIIDNYRISGIIKNYFVKLLEGAADEITPLQRGILQKEGLSISFLNKLEGK